MSLAMSMAMSSCLCGGGLGRVEGARVRVRGRASVRRGRRGWACASARVVRVTGSDDFEAVLAGAGGALVVVDVSGKSCGPCKVIYPYFCELADTMPDAVFAYLVGDENEGTKALAKSMGVKALPHFRFYRDGVLLDKFSGADKDKLRRAVETCAADAEGTAVQDAVAREAQADALKDVSKGLAERLKGL